MHHAIQTQGIQRPPRIEENGKSATPGDGAIIFDEIQLFPPARQAIKALVADGRFHYIETSSLISIKKNVESVLIPPEEQRIPMLPMDFEEFSWAMGVDGSLWDAVRSCFEKVEPIPDFLHSRFVELFYRYVLVGGMPEAVQTFVTSNDTQAMRARQRGILDAYRADITRYVSDRLHAQRIKTIFEAIPAQLNKENRRFIVSGIDNKRRFEDMQSDFDWLVNAGVAIPVKRASDAVFPLGLSREDSYFKFYMNDVGLLFSTFSPADVEAVVACRDDINFGQVFENVVAQELRAHGRASLFYFNTTKVGEVDFLIEARHTPDVLPVEVKSGRYSTKHAALDRLLQVENYGLDKAVVLHTGNISRDGVVTYLPIYMAGLL